MTAHRPAPPWWQQYVELVVELGVGTSVNENVEGRWDRAEWDDAASGTWSGLEPAWLPVDPCNLLEVGVDRGRDRWLDRFGASSATLSIQDPDGALSWDSADTDDQLQVRPGREVRIRARVQPTGHEFPVWRGWIETIDDTFAPGETPVARFTAQDGYAQLAHIDPLESAPVGAGETSDERIHRLLDVAEWPDEWRDVDAGRVTVQATNLARAIADDLGITADSEGGAVYADRDGRIAFRNRDWLRTDIHATTVQATVGGADVPYPPVPAASYLQLGATTHIATTPSPATPSPATELDVRAWVAVDDYSGASQPFYICKAAGAGARDFLLYQPSWAGGSLALYFSPDGTVEHVPTSTVPLPFAPGAKVHLRALLRTNASGAWTVDFYTSTDDDLEPVWVPLGTQRSGTGAPSVYHSAQPLTVGYYQASPIGRVYAASVRVNGVTVAAPDFRSSEPGTASIVDGPGNVWTMANGAAIVGTPAVPGTAHVCGASYDITRSAADIVNDVQLGRAGGTVQRYVDEGSISTYRHRSYNRTDYICEDDDQVALLARRILDARAGGQVRMPSLTVIPTDDAAAWEFVLAVDYGWRLEVHYPAVDGTDWTRTVIVQGVAHKVTPDGWECELRVDDAATAAADVWNGPDGWDRALWSEAI